MNKLLLFLILMSQFLFPQLKEMEVKPTTQKGGIPINRDNPEKAAIFFYTQFDNLDFWSNYGIVEVKGDPAGGKYIVIVEPVRQTIEVRRKGFKSEIIKIESLQPRDVLYYDILPKKDEGIQGVGELAITVQALPPDASVFLNGEPVTNNVSTKVTIGIHRLKVEKTGYKTYESEISITPEQTFFKVNLEKVQLSPLTINSKPTGAKIYINGANEGTTDQGLFLYPGVYNLRLELTNYLPVIEKITVAPGSEAEKNTFTYTLKKNKGNLQLSVFPSDARMTLNGNVIFGGTHELSPGKYTLEVSANKYDATREEIEIKRGETFKRDIKLVKNTGIIILSVKPKTAVVTINKEIKSGTSFEMSPGTYELEVSAHGYYTETEAIKIEKGKTVTRNINLKQKTGTLQFTIKPLGAKVALTQNGIEKYNWSGIKLLEAIPEGSYDLSANANGFKTYTQKVTIKENRTTIENIQMISGSDKPGWLVYVEGGTFTMGSSDGDSDEKPAHQVTVSSFYISSTEVTLRSFEEFIKATGYETDADKNGGSYLWKDSIWEKKRGVSWRCDTKGNIRGSGEKNHPVIHVSWNDAIAYCNWLSDKEALQKAYSGSGSNITCDFTSNGYRLPTEAEWEYAARGGNQSGDTEYSGSNSLDEVAWYYDNSGYKTHQVGTKQRNELDIYDMSGNVWEWCWDWYSGTYYTSASQTNPKGPSTGSRRVLRGGSWIFGAESSRVVNRGGDGPGSGTFDRGFRVVRTR